VQRAKSPTFRPTVWPAEPPAVPPVIRYDLTPLENGRVRVVDVDRERELVQLPPDFVLRELLEVSDNPADLRDFMREWGLLVDLPHEGSALDLARARRRLRELQAVARHLLAYRGGEGEEAEREAWSSAGLERPGSATQARHWSALVPIDAERRAGRLQRACPPQP
jgi:hypothetical protein